jgi:RNA polymerase sigma-70 factor (ECF subfamily)
MAKSDQALIRAVLAGDKDAYGDLAARHGDSMFRVAFRITESEPDAQEIVQEALLRGYRNLAAFDARSDFRTWIYRIAINCALQALEKRKSQAAMEKMTPDERLAFVLRHLEGRSTEEIAVALEITPNNARQAVFRAVQKMRRSLAPLWVKS